MSKTWDLVYNKDLKRFELLEGKNLIETSEFKTCLFIFARVNDHSVKDLAKREDNNETH